MSTMYYLRDNKGNLKAQLGGGAARSLVADDQGYWDTWRSEEGTKRCVRVTKDAVLRVPLPLRDNPLHAITIYFWKGDVLVPADD